MARKDLMRDVAHKHTETMEQLYPEEIKKCIARTQVYGNEFTGNGKKGTGAL